MKKLKTPKPKWLNQKVNYVSDWQFAIYVASAIQNGSRTYHIICLRIYLMSNAKFTTKSVDIKLRKFPLKYSYWPAVARITSLLTAVLLHAFLQDC